MVHPSSNVKLLVIRIYRREIWQLLSVAQQLSPVHLRQTNFQRMSQWTLSIMLGLTNPFLPTRAISAKIGPTSIGLAGLIYKHSAIRSPHHPDQFALGFHLPAGNAGPLGYMLASHTKPSIQPDTVTWCPVNRY